MTLRDDSIAALKNRAALRSLAGGIRIVQMVFITIKKATRERKERRNEEQDEAEKVLLFRERIRLTKARLARMINRLNLFAGIIRPEIK